MNYFKDLKKIVTINSYTKNKVGVDSVSAIMTKWFEELDFETKKFEREHIGNHYLYVSPKREGSKILFLGHNDTVFPPGEFETYKEDDEWVYGPGVCDMKGGNIVALQALRNVFKQNGEIVNIDMFLVSDEEQGSSDSREITAQLAKEYDICFVFEAAGRELEIVTERKGIETFTIEIEGKGAHSGVRYCEGINANLEAAYKLIELTKLTNLDIGTTVNVGRIEGGIGANTISPHATLLLDLRYTKASEKERLLTSVENITNKSYVKGTKATLLRRGQRDVMESNSIQCELVKRIENIVKTPLLTESRGGVSDANIVASQGVSTIDGFGPFGDGDHTVRERALKPSFEQRIELMTKIVAYHQEHKQI